MSDVDFSPLDIKSIDYVSKNIASRAFASSCHGTKYWFPDDELRKIACDKLYKIFVSMTVEETGGFVLSHNENSINTNADQEAMIGYIAILKSYDLKSIIPFLLSSPINLGFSFLWRFAKYLIADEISVKAAEKHIGKDFWKFYGVSIDVNKQSMGYGSKMLSLSHEYCKTVDVDIPMFFTTPTPRALKFYLKNGYKITSKVHINDELTK